MIKIDGTKLIYLRMSIKSNLSSICKTGFYEVVTEVSDQDFGFSVISL